MSKTYYSDYVRHSLRFYTRNHPTKPFFKSGIDRNNWLACDKILQSCQSRELKILLDVYSGYDTLPDEVYKASQKYNIEQNIIWDLMKDVEKKIARKRGLL